MSNGLRVFHILIGTSASLALIFHWIIRRYWVASLSAAVATGVVFQCLGYLQTGYLDPFFLIALVTSCALGLVVALLVGLPFFFLRRQRAGEQ